MGKVYIGIQSKIGNDEKYEYIINSLEFYGDDETPYMVAISCHTTKDSLMKILTLKNPKIVFEGERKYVIVADRHSSKDDLQEVEELPDKANIYILSNQNIWKKIDGSKENQYYRIEDAEDFQCFGTEMDMFVKIGYGPEINVNNI